MNIVFDACSLIAFFRDEPGANVVKNYLTEENYTKMVHSINLCEVYYDFLKSDGQATAQSMIDDVFDLDISIKSDLTMDFWKQVGQYKADIKRISLADCFALTLANRHGAILLTSDHKEFDPIVSLQICEICFIR
jgi:PIN domain nuclease of toxin-antitoxin system